MRAWLGWGMAGCLAAAAAAGCGNRQFGLPDKTRQADTKKVVVKKDTPRERKADVAAQDPWGKPQKWDYITRDANTTTRPGVDSFDPGGWEDPAMTSIVQIGPVTRRAGKVSMAIDQLEGELSEAMKLRPVLMVWLIDTTNSARVLREDALSGLERIVSRFGKDQTGDKAMYAVVSFGENVAVDLPEPTNDPEVVKKALQDLKEDDGGLEKPFAALQLAAEKFGKYRTEMNRYLMFVVVSDEAGDEEKVDAVVSSVQALAAPVYVLGAPAPFGKRGSLVNDNGERASPQDPTGVRQGPETCEKEMVDVAFIAAKTGFGRPGVRADEDVVDSGFGPWALSRVCFASGGAYYTIPEGPSRTPLDPVKLAEYAPEYVSAAEYRQLVEGSPAKQALLSAARLPRVPAPSLPEQLFPKADEGRMKNLLTEAQKAAARVEPAAMAVYEALKKGEKDRDSLDGKRWQAAFDLAMGRTLAARVRIEGYNAMLANLKLGKRSQNPNSTGWMLRQSEQIDVSSQLAKMQKDATAYLQRVIDQHPGTPWAELAQRELKSKMGWVWSEE